MNWSIVFDRASLFKDVLETSKNFIVSNAQIYKVKKGEIFVSDKNVLVFILKGSASVFGKTKEKTVLLNTLYAGEIFGMASLFGGKCETSEIVAREECTFALLSQKEIEEVMKNDITFTSNYISVLSDKIRFLNKKISFFTSGSAENRVLEYLLSLPVYNHQIEVEMNLSKLASTLDIGRASLYRAFDALEEKGLFKREGNVFTIISLEEMKKMMGEIV